MKEMNIFKIPDQDDNQLIVDTHYFKWLQKNQFKDIHAIETKKKYLAEIGFEIGEEWLEVGDITRLQYIERHYFMKIKESKTI